MEIKEKSEASWREELGKLHELRLEEEDLDDEEELSFSNLRKLDREIPRRVSLKQHPPKPRTSVVEFREDEFITYEASESGPSNPVPRPSVAMMKDILEGQKKELEGVSKENSDQNIVVVEGKKRKQKSILKCSIMQRLPEESKSSMVSNEPLDVTRILDIDGKPVKSSSEVRFVSSEIAERREEFDPSKLKEKAKRKSSIKHSAFISAKPEVVQNGEAGRTSFLGLKNTDGKVLRKGEKEARRERCSSGSSDSSAEHNVFGDYEVENIEKQIQDVFGRVVVTQESSPRMGPRARRQWARSRRSRSSRSWSPWGARRALPPSSPRRACSSADAHYPI